MSDTLVLKMIDALRDMAAKVDETVTREEPDIDEMMRFPTMNAKPLRVVTMPRYEREWIAGRLLGMADVAEAFLVERPEPPHER